MEKNCCICGSYLEELQKGVVNIFALEKLSSTAAVTDDSLAKLLSKTLNRDVTSLKNTRLEKLCRTCFRSVIDISDIEQRLDSMKLELKRKFEDTNSRFMKEVDQEIGKNPKQRISIVFRDTKKISAPELHAEELEVSTNYNQPEGVPSATEEFVVIHDYPSVPEEYRDLIQPDGTFKCRFCKRRFADLASDLHHMVDYHKAVSVRCSICDESYNNILELRRHKMTDHPEFSDEKTFRVNDLVLRNLECNRCDRQFPNNKSLNIHVKMCHKDGISPSGPHSDILEMNVSCSICDYQCCNQEELLDHLHEDHWVDRPYCCHHCLLVYKSREEYTLHVKHKHKGDHVCSRCYSKLDSEKEFESHVRDHFKRPQFILECKFCTLKFTEKELLDDHMHLKHGDGTDKECLFLDEDPAMEVELGASEVVCEAPSNGLEEENYVLMGSDSLMLGTRVSRECRPESDSYVSYKSYP